jgi:protein-histidine pros-kinase
MSLRLKFNLILILTSIIGLTIASYISYNLFREHARQEVLEKAAIMMESAEAIRSYTVTEIRPLLRQLESEEFIAQTVPAYAANQYVRELQKKHPDYSYKEATLNPTNPADRATEWEADIIEHFRNHDNQQELIGERQTATGPMLYMSRPIKITNPSCLVCHDTPATAPKSLIERYGSSNGFGWKLNEIIGAQVVSVPQSLALQRAQREFYTFTITIVGVFILVGIILNLLLHWFVISPVKGIANHADDVSMGTLERPELHANGKDEMALLARSFNRMHRSLKSAMSMLGDS